MSETLGTVLQAFRREQAKILPLARVSMHSCYINIYLFTYRDQM
jgi:hypothetical protein